MDWYSAIIGALIWECATALAYSFFGPKRTRRPQYRDVLDAFNHLEQKIESSLKTTR